MSPGQRRTSKPRTGGALDREDEVVGQHPAFLEVMQRSEASYRVEGGIPLEELVKRFGPRRKTTRAARGAVR